MDGRRGAITIKSSPITAGWVTHKRRTIIPQKSTHWNEGSEPHFRLPNMGGPATGGGIPRESDFEGQRDLIAGLQQNWGNQRLHS